MAAATDIADRQAYVAHIAVSAGDLLVATAYAVVVATAISVGAVTGPTRVVLAAPLLGFTPGYAVVSALFPARPAADIESAAVGRARSARWLERLSMSVGTSLFVLVVSALVLSVAGVSLRLDALLGVVVAVTVGGSLTGLVRRYRLPQDARVVVPAARVADRVRAATVDARPMDAALNIALAVAVILAASTLAVGFAAPNSGESYTEVALLTDEDDSLVAGNYTETVQRGEPVEFTLSIENQLGEASNYTAVVVLERLAEVDGERVVVERDELDRQSVELDDGETTRRQLSVTPSTLGDDLRLSVFVYPGDAPDTAGAGTAPNHLYLWLDVERADGTTERVTDGAAPDGASTGGQ